MNQKIIIYSIALLVTLVASCQPESLDAGASALQEADDIRVKADTFPLSSHLAKCAAISLTPDSFLLGECDTHFGTIKADILTQLACPVGFQYPISSNPADLVVDSVCLYLYYRDWYGDGLAPLGIRVYEMDKATLNYNERYPSDTTLHTFCSLEDSTCLVHPSRVVFAQEYKDSVYLSNSQSYMPSIRIKLSDDFAQRFFSVRDFSSQERFNELFKGLYITTDFGGSTMLYVTNISMAVFYHFPSSLVSESRDTTINDVKAFYANSEVRQINRYLYPDREQVLEDLSLRIDTNYIVSPANIYTRLSLSMDSVFNRIQNQLGDEDDYRVYVNRANLTVDVLYDAEQNSTRPRDQWDLPAEHMLLIREDKMESFFAKNELPVDTTAILSSLITAVDSLGNISYSYQYSLAGLLTQQLRLATLQSQLHFLLVPVAVTSSNSSVTSVKQLQTISATRIRSSHHSDYPMNVELLYSGFNEAY